MQRWQKRVILPTLGVVSRKLKEVGSRGLRQLIDLVKIYQRVNFTEIGRYTTMQC